MRRLYDVAKDYVQIIETLEMTSDREKIIDLEERRIECHNELMELLKREGIAYTDREHVTRLAYAIVRWEK